MDFRKTLLKSKNLCATVIYLTAVALIAPFFLLFFWDLLFIDWEKLERDEKLRQEELDKDPRGCVR